MPILRKASGDYAKVAKLTKKHERHPDDFDLAFADYRLYVLDDHEWFDPRTSSQRGHHAFYGPAVIVVCNNQGGLRTEEHHVNDPTVWAWIRRCIAEGHLTAATLAEGINNEREITVG